MNSAHRSVDGTTADSPALPWSDADRRLRIAILFQDHIRLTDEIHESIRASIDDVADVVFEDAGCNPSKLQESNADLVVVPGGDGSILRAARCMGNAQIPVLGVNLGKLGFLAEVPFERFAEAMQAVATGNCHIISHLMFDCEVVRAGESISCTLGLNETAILSGPPYSLMEIDLYVDDEMATTYSCDGLIISTPVGSTAHSLSAGGPILRKDLQAFVISPVSPHTLTVRPVVDTADRVYEMAVRQMNDVTSVVVDGQLITHLEPMDRVRVRRAAPQFQLIQAPGNTYYQTLREKLGWGGRIASKRRSS